MIKNRSGHQFDRDLEVSPAEDNTFEVTLSDAWANAGTPNGGYLMGVISRVMAIFFPKKGSPILTANFIARCRPGKALVCVEVISKHGSFTRLMARLIQSGKEKIRAFGTFSSEKMGEGDGRVMTDYGGSPPDMAPHESSFLMLSKGYNSLYDQVELKLDPSGVGWIKKKLSRPMEVKGWIRFKDPRILDMPAIMMFADAFPPPVFVAHGPEAWVPTLEMSVNIRKVPSDMMLRGVFRSRFISSGLVEEDGELWDLSGELVALSRQYALYRKP